MLSDKHLDKKIAQGVQAALNKMRGGSVNRFRISSRKWLHWNNIFKWPVKSG